MTLTIHHVDDILIDRYQVVAYVGAGGMQEVYLAKDLVLERDVALKVPKTSSAVRRFRQSAVLSARVNHPNAARTFDYFNANSRQYLVEEFVRGEDLSKILRHIQRLDPNFVAHTLHHLAKALAALHHVDVIHRDLKPSNIMIAGGTRFDEFKITDFGVAKMAAAEISDAVAGGQESVTGSSTALGALPYLAPEAIAGEGPVGKGVDVWAIGAIAFELLTGQKPFGQGYKAIPTILEAKTPQLPPSVTKKPQFGPLATSIHGILRRCLDADVAARLTADQLVTECEKLCYSVHPRTFGVARGFRGAPPAFGFIDVDGGGIAFFHFDSVFGPSPVEGSRVWFATYPGSPRDRAHPVIVVP